MKSVLIAFLILLTSVNYVGAQTPSATTSTVSVSPPVIPTSGTTTITVQLKEANGTNLTSGGATVSFVTPSSGTIGSVTDNLDGSYTAIYKERTVTIGNPESIAIDKVSIYDIQGRLVFSINTNGATGSQTINVSDLSSAVYMVVIESAGKQRVKRLIRK